MYSKKRSFTFVEIMVSTALFAVVVGPMIFSIGAFNKLTGTANGTAVVMLAAQSKIDEMSVSDYSQLVTQFNGQPFDVVGVNNPTNGNQHGLVSVGNVNNSGLFDIVVTISWSYNGRDYSRSFETSFVQKG